MNDKSNNIAQALFIIGILSIIGGVISGLYYGTSVEYYPLGNFQGVLSWTVLLSGVVSGIVFLGFSELIKLLQGIYNLQKNKQNEMDLPGSKEEATLLKEPVIHDTRDFRVVPDKVRRDIEGFYKNEQVDKIVATRLEDYYIVTLKGKEVVIEMGGFKPTPLSDQKARGLGLL
ncbi:hypothetical protein [Robertmurraya korlensis]|uniref:hypothetical protein n=1 Tax=Robertmurraya korlensis TaxID=519977 RepID=UPI0008260CC3|nr:hypothetical protein [Robertmurraya korlensis]